MASFACSALKEQPQLQVIGEASDGLEAVRQAQELQPDLILMDIGLPKLNGIEAAFRIHQIHPNAKILFASQNEDADVVRAALNNGAHGYVLKADAKNELLAAVEEVIRGGRFVSERLRSPKRD